MKISVNVDNGSILTSESAKTFNMNKIVSRVGQAGLMAALGYEFGQNSKDTQIVLEKQVPTVKEIRDNEDDEKVLFYIIIILLIALIFMCAIAILFRKLRVRPQAQPRVIQ